MWNVNKLAWVNINAVCPSHDCRFICVMKFMHVYHANYFGSKREFKYLLPLFIHPPSNCGTKNVLCVSLCGDKYYEILWNVHKLVWVRLITLINVH